MNYPWTRMFQRYEYVMQKGYITDKRVVDVGCGGIQCPIALTKLAASVVGVDPGLDKMESPYFVMPPRIRPELATFIRKSIFDVDVKGDVVLAIEVLEHMREPIVFIKRIAEVAPFAFITTPLRLGEMHTRNPQHVKEYSISEFRSMLHPFFTVEDPRYQTASLEIVNTVLKIDELYFDSLDDNHIVQMAWCKRK